MDNRGFPAEVYGQHSAGVEAADDDLALVEGDALDGPEDQARAVGLQAVTVGLDGLGRVLGSGRGASRGRMIKRRGYQVRESGG